MQHMGTPTPRAHTSWVRALASRVSHTPRARPQQNRNGFRLSPPSSRSRTVSFAPRKGAAKCHGHGGAARGLPLPGAKGERRGRAAHAPGALARNHLQALHWRLVAYLNCPCPASSPPHRRVPLTASSVERSVPSRASRCWRGKRTSAVWLVRRQGLRA